MTPIRTTDKDGIAGILATGRPAGYWMAHSEAFPRIWTGVVADGRRAVRKLGTFGEVLEWLHLKAGILRDTRADRVIRDSSDTFRGVRVSSDAAVRIPEQDMPRAKAYTGFSVKAEHGKRGLRTPAHDGMRHGNALPDNPCRKERSDRDEEILRLSREGLIQKDIAERLGVSETCVNARVRKMRKRGIEVPRVMKDKQKAGQLERAMEMKRMRDEEGLRAKEISARTGIHINTVYMLLKIADGKEAGG